MHTIGQLPIHMVFPKAGADIEEVCKGRNMLERHEVEHTILGTDHNLVGENLAKHWHFPEEISRVIRYYTDPLSKEACRLAQLFMWLYTLHLIWSRNKRRNILQKH